MSRRRACRPIRLRRRPWLGTATILITAAALATAGISAVATASSPNARGAASAGHAASRHDVHLAHVTHMRAVSQFSGPRAASATLSSVAVTPADPSVPFGGTLQLTATGTYSDGTTMDLTKQAAWSSSGSAVTVSNTSGSQGLASGVSVGSATVTAALSGVSGSTLVTVTALVYAPGAIRHVIWIMMENHSASTIIGSSRAPYIHYLMAQYGLASNYLNIAHPSLPNYLGSVSGAPLSSLPLTDCTSCKQAGPSIFTQGETWKSYQESMTVPCKPFKSPDGLYVPRHNPALYYTSIPPATCKADDVPYPVLATDLAQNNLPAFSFITPNLADDMHNGPLTVSVGVGDTWLANNLPSMLSSPDYRAGTTAIFLTWDEGSGVGNVKGTDCIHSPTNASCQVALVVVSPYTTPGTIAPAAFNHYSLLGATEDLLGLPLLGQASVAPDLAPAFGM